MIKIKNRTIIFLLGAVLFLAAVNCAVAADFDDGFGQAKKVQGEHFTIYYAPEVDLGGIIKSLNISPAATLLAPEASKKGNSCEAELACEIEALFLQISDFLDMHVYSFQGTIKICRDYEHLKKVYAGIYGGELKSYSLYASASNTIYICPEYFKQGVVGHEMAHAIISRYFVVQPPERAAEILAGYVEYELKKSNH